MMSSTPGDNQDRELLCILEEAFQDLEYFKDDFEYNNNEVKYFKGDYEYFERTHYDRISRKVSDDKRKTYADAEQWWLEHEGDCDLLRRAANQRDKYDFTVLWYLVRLRPQIAFVRRILQLAPDIIKVKLFECSLPLTLPLPLHAAIKYHAPYDVIKLLLDTYPEAVTVKNDKLLFHNY